MSSQDLNLSIEEITYRLSLARNRNESGISLEFPYPPGFFSAPPRDAAVLMPLLNIDHCWHLLFTRRNVGLPEHSGQVAFPGGRADAEDPSLDKTALRETYEEIGILPEDVTILGSLQVYHTITNYLVTPFVGVVKWPYALEINHHEVSRTFTIPLNWLANPANFQERTRILPPPYQPVKVIYFQPYDGEVLWGASARFTLALLNTLGWFGD
jgi:8-oxo-dGTP pyrophosphatase MutT (NUDIX family)